MRRGTDRVPPTYKTIAIYAESRSANGQRRDGGINHQAKAQVATQKTLERESDQCSDAFRMSTASLRGQAGEGPCSDLANSFLSSSSETEKMLSNRKD